MYVHQEFKDQLERKADGSCETALMWEPGHSALHSNKNGSLSRLKNLIKNLRKQLKEFEQYDQVNQTHLSEAIIEKAPKEIKGTKIYLPHKPVVREKVESTKMRTVYDAFTESVISSPSLNECLGTR